MFALVAQPLKSGLTATALAEWESSPILNSFLSYVGSLSRELVAVL
jgi:hypothetical protein